MAELLNVEQKTQDWFTVIIPVKNREELLVRCLESVERQTYRPLRVIVVDNGSTDNTLRVAQQYSGKHCADDFRIDVVQELSCGACAARNKGLAMATSRWISFFDSDDTMRPQMIEKAAGELAKLPEGSGLAVWRTCRHFLDGSTRLSKFFTSRLMENHLVHAMLATANFAADRQLVIAAGGWNESLPRWNDWELGVRILLQRHDVAYIPEVLADIYCQKESITGVGFSPHCGDWEKSLVAVERALRSGGRDELLPIVDYRRVILAAHYKKESGALDGRMTRRKVIAEGAASSLLYGALQKYPKWSKTGLALRISYEMTRRGLRGAYMLFGRML